MCVSPLLIKNPNYGCKTEIAKYKDTVSQYIYVPCGYCPECLHKKQLQLVQRVQMESYNSYMFFATLTYNNESLRTITTSTGYTIPYADFSDIRNMVKRIRNDNLFTRPFRYFVVSELGSKRGRPHFHAIFFLPKYANDNIYIPLNLERTLRTVVLDQWKRNYGSRRNPNYKSLCTFTQKFTCYKLFQNYDLHYIKPSAIDGTNSDVSFYVTKYLLKYSERVVNLQRALKLNLDYGEYRDTWNLVKPRWFASKCFGFGLYGIQNNTFNRNIIKDTPQFHYIQSGIERSHNTDFPCFFSPDSGKPFPLSRYWYQHNDLFTLEDYKFFKSLQDTLEGNVVPYTRTPQEYEQTIYKHRKQCSIIENNDLTLDL